MSPTSYQTAPPRDGTPSLAAKRGEDRALTTGLQQRCPIGSPVARLSLNLAINGAVDLTLAITAETRSCS